MMTIIGLFTLAIGVSFVYAEERTIQVPFDVVGWNCQLVTETMFNCFFSGKGQISVSDDGVVTEVPDEPEETIEEEIVEEPVIPEVTMTREEKEIQRVIDRITDDLETRPDAVPQADKQLLELLLRAQDKCEFGIEEGQPIQTYQIFSIPKGYFYPEDTDFSKYNMLGKITRLVQACVDWEEYKVEWLGPQYDNIRKANEEAITIAENRNISRDLFAKEWMKLENITIADEYMNAAISKHDILEEEEDAAKFMCSEIGKQRGFCPSGIGEDVYVYDGTNNPALAKYLEYKADPENQVGEPRYSVSTDPKCYTLESFSKQYDLDEESRRALLEAAGCRL